METYSTVKRIVIYRLREEGVFFESHSGKSIIDNKRRIDGGRHYPEFRLTGFL